MIARFFFPKFAHLFYLLFWDYCGNKPSFGIIVHNCIKGLFSSCSLQRADLEWAQRDLHHRGRPLPGTLGVVLRQGGGRRRNRGGGQEGRHSGEIKLHPLQYSASQLLWQRILWQFCLKMIDSKIAQYSAKRKLQSWPKKFVLGCVISPLHQQGESRSLGQPFFANSVLL